MRDKRKTTRRQFLAGHSAVEALGDLTHGEMPVPSGTTASLQRNPGTYLIEVTRRAMACEFAVMLNADRQSLATEAAVAALDLVDRLEDQLTVYREHSEISGMNRLASLRWVNVEPRLLSMLEYAVQLSGETDGAFDITSGPLSKVWGFYRREGRVPAEPDLTAALERIGSRHIEFDDDNLALRFNLPGMEINLGGIGKGYALDRCVELLTARGVENFLLHGGQSSVVARGARFQAGEKNSGWTVGLRHPLRPERRLAEFRLRNRALGTSGMATQSFYHQGRRYGHILDPRTGWPADGMHSATVIAPLAATADALATAFYVLGVDSARDFCARHSELAAVLVTPGNSSGSVDVHAFGLTDNDWTLLDS